MMEARTSTEAKHLRRGLWRMWGMPGKQSLTWNTALYLFLEPVMQSLDEN